MEIQNTGGASAHADNVTRFPNLYQVPCEIQRAASWPYECIAKDRHPDHEVWRCESHGVWWHTTPAGRFACVCGREFRREWELADHRARVGCLLVKTSA